jgi:hypothetical protein
MAIVAFQGETGQRQLRSTDTTPTLAAALTAPGYLCPRYERCSAAICPGGLGGTHLPGEPTCRFLREAVKAGGRARVEGALHQDLAEAVLRYASELISQSGPLARALRQASKKGSSMERGRRAMRRLRETR